MPLEIHLATVLLEKNRWGPAPRRPEARLSPWLQRVADAGFTGLELWENHWRLADDAERAALRASPAPVRIFNSYLSPSAATDAEIRELAGALTDLGGSVRGMKFNLEAAPASLDAEIAAGRRLAEKLPAGVALWCECHPDTVVDAPQTAAVALARWPADRFGLMMHPFLGDDETFARWLQLPISRLAHLHLQMRDEHDRMIRFTDRADRARHRLAGLLSAGYAGSMSIEFTAGVGTPGEAMEQLFANAVADLRFVRKLLRDLRGID